VIGLYFDGFLVSESFGFRYVIPWAKNSGNVLGSLINPNLSAPFDHGNNLSAVITAQIA
jgi:hypothetical protein